MGASRACRFFAIAGLVLGVRPPTEGEADLGICQQEFFDLGVLCWTFSLVHFRGCLALNTGQPHGGVVEGVGSGQGFPVVLLLDK